MAKGIRLNQIAKELGVQSKIILDKCREEGLGDKVKNHQSNVPLGLAETIREWFSDGAGGTAVEVAGPVDTAVLEKVKTKSTKRPAKASANGADGSDGSDEGDEGGGVATAVAAPGEGDEGDENEGESMTSTMLGKHPRITMDDDEAEASVNGAHGTNGHAAEKSAEKPAAEVPAEAAPEVEAEAPAVAEPEAEKPTPKPAEKGEKADKPAPRVAAEADDRANLPPIPETRPTVTLENRGTIVQKPSRETVARQQAEAAAAEQAGQEGAESPAVTPAPQLTELTRVKMQGPKLIRTEKADVVPAPRKRMAPGTAGGPNTAFNRAMPRGGGGVKVTTTAEDEAEAAKKKAGRSLSARRRGPDGRRGEAMEKLREFTEADIIARKDALNAAAASRARFDHHLKGAANKGKGVRALTGAQRGGAVQVEEPITVKSLSAALGVKGTDIIRKLMKQGVFATINQGLDGETAEMLAIEYGVELEVAEQRTLEDQLVDEFAAHEVKPENLRSRPPVVTILGHVDHGKTSLLDKIRTADVASGESGGITQHIAAFSVALGEGDAAKRVTFIDTPGHQAFTAMRARGANMTDIVVLVIDAAQGIQPQTVESINHAKAAGVPLVVAMNKIDRPDANPDKILGQLSANELNPVEYGGSTEVVRTSATTGQGIADLIEVLDLQAEIMELRADPTSPSRGVVIEARVDLGLGPVCTVLVQQGTLRVGDVLLAGTGYGRIRALMTSDGKSVKQVGPSTPVVVSGLSELPAAGDKFFQIDDFDRARSVAEERADTLRRKDLANYNKVSLDNLFESMDDSDINTINLIIKGDVAGSVETLTRTVTEQNTSEVRVRVIHSGVGAVNESDVELADASGAVVIGFHTAIDEAARRLAEERDVEVRQYQVIYEIFDDLKKALEGQLAPEIREKYHGTAEIREVFKVSRLGNIAGCLITDGHVQRGSKVRLSRDGTIVTDGVSIDSLKRLKDDAREVKQGLECGIKLAGYDDIKVSDKLEFYVREEHKRTL